MRPRQCGDVIVHTKMYKAYREARVDHKRYLHDKSLRLMCLNMHWQLFYSDQPHQSIATEFTPHPLAELEFV